MLNKGNRNMSRREILTAHYLGLTKKIVTWAGLAALVAASTLVSSPANAAQITSRKVTLGSSTTSTSTTYGFSMVLPTTGTNIQSFAAEVCTTALGACSTPAGFGNGSSTISVAPANFGASGVWVVNTATAGSIRMTTNGGTATTGGPSGTSTVTFGSVTNPSSVNTTFYLRITTYSANNWTSAIDNGTVAVSTTLAAPNFQVNANVAESLTFCVGQTGTSCSGGGALTGTDVTLTPDPMGSTAVSYGTAKMVAATNGLTGYTITYNATNMTSGGNTITKAADGGTVSAAGTEQFGFTLTNQTSGSGGGSLSGQGAAPSGGTGVTLDGNYDNQDSTIAYDISGPTDLATASGPTTETVYTMLYAANVGVTTEPGAYSANQVFIATATF
jgi:hypothetical protein